MAFSLWPNSTLTSKPKEQVSETNEDGKTTEQSTLPSQSQTSDCSSVATPTTQDNVCDSSHSAKGGATDGKSSSSPAVPSEEKQPTHATTVNGVSSTPASKPSIRPRVEKRFSWRSLVRRRAAHERKASLPHREELAKEATVRKEYVEHQIHRSRSEKRALKSALVLRELIVGPFAVPSAAPPKKSKLQVSSKPPSAQKVKSQLLQPKSAKKVIAQLRRLPGSDVPVAGKTSAGEEFKYLPSGPIHAVCLACPDAEANEKHFAKLDQVDALVPSSSASPKIKERSMTNLSQAVDGITSVTATSIDKLKSMLSDLDIISLITVPDWGLGQPADAPGLLSGAVPSAKAILEGVEQITPQLMALGYATGKSILPSHAGVYPPTDRISVITYWWGLEVVIPEPSVQYLSNAPSIAHTVVNFLTALSVANGGVREILPFVRYISTYIDAEFSAIRDQDQGQGVVCAATWLMPAALVPRTWDFPQPPADSKPSDGDKDGSVPHPSTPGPGAILIPPPVPNPNTAPVFVAPTSTTAAQSHSPTDKSKADDDVPEVTVTPPTPPTSHTLSKAVGADIAANVSAPADVMAVADVNGVAVVSPEEAADKVDESGVAAVGEAGAGKGVVNGAPAALLLM